MIDARPPARALAAAGAAVIAGGTFAIAFDGGGYGLTSRNSAAVLLLWLLAVGVAFGLWPRAPIPVPAIVVGGFLAAFTLWTGLSVLWAPSIEKSVAEFNRAVLYLALFAVVLVSTSGERAARTWLRGLAIGITAVGILALLSRLFPEQFENTSAVSLAQLYPSAGRRLNYPIEYWNSLATLIALGVPCLLWAATIERRAVVRALAVLPLPALAAALYLTSSRGGVAVTVLAVAAFAALARRWRALGAIAVSTAASVPPLLALAERNALTKGPLTPGAVSEGESAAVIIAIACLAGAVVYGLISAVRLDLGRSAVPLGWGVAAGAFATLVIAIAVLDPVDRFERFKAVPAAPTLENQSVQGHLVNTSGNGRWQLWEAAVEQFSVYPVVGEGAGSYEAWWAEHGTLATFVRDAHSLYLEVLGELGIVGLLLLAGALTVGLGVGIRRSVQAATDERVTCAALVAAYLAWLVEAGIDWMWESTVVTLVAIACLALLVGPATALRWRAGRPRGRSLLAARVTIPFVSLVLIAAQGSALLGQLATDRSQAAVRGGDAQEARDAAAAAQRIQPWASSPHLQRALVEELRGDLRAARTAIRRALARDERDWRLFLIEARIETKLRNFDRAAESLRRAIALNPRSSRFEGLPRVTG